MNHHAATGKCGFCGFGSDTHIGRRGFYLQTSHESSLNLRGHREFVGKREAEALLKNETLINL